MNPDIEYDDRPVYPAGEPPPSNGGLTNYRVRVGVIKNVRFSQIPENYLTDLWQGYDSVQECFNRRVRAEFVRQMDDLKKILQDDDRGDGVAGITLGVETFNITSYAPRGFKYFVKNDDFELFFGNQDTDWAISCRYLSAGLLEHGVHALRKRVIAVLNSICKVNHDVDWIRLSRIDVAFDFHSPDFTLEMKPSLLEGVVCPQKTKQRVHDTVSGVIRGRRIETLTMGSKKSLEVQIYDKTREIREASGKTYFYKAWGKKYDSDVWRVELRFFADYLRNRNIRTLEQFEEYAGELLGEGLMRRRLAVNDGTKNQTRWALHPLWTRCYELAGCPSHALRIGRYVTEKPEILEKLLIKQLAGTTRSLAVLRGNEIDAEEIEILLDGVGKAVFEDKQHLAKVQRAKDRYKFVKEAGQ